MAFKSRSLTVVGGIGPGPLLTRAAARGQERREYSNGRSSRLVSWQKEQVSARSESSSGRRLVSSASSRLPQWQRPVSGASLRDVSRPLIAPLALDLAPVPPREVDDLELHPVRIGEEDRIVLRAVFRVLRRRIEDRDPLPHEELVKAIHLVPAPDA